MQVEPLLAVLVHASEAVGAERRCSRAVQLAMDVLGVADHAAEASEAAMSVRTSEPVATLACQAVC